jgi:antitoxin HicB
MKTKEKKKAVDHSGSSFTDFLEEEGISEEAEAIALKRVIVWQLQQAMKEQGKTKQALAKEIKTSRSQLDRLLDPENVSISPVTIARAADVLGKRIVVRMDDVGAKA